MKVFKFIFKLIFFISCFIFFIICSIYIYSYFSGNFSIESANSYYIYDNKDNLVNIGSSGSWTTLDNIDNKVLTYIVGIEDQHFYNHLGFDYFRIIKSLLLNIKNKKIVAGASSISQQYVKNLYLDFNQTWKRKINEAWLTIKLETHYSKDEILEGYLNTIYFGQGIYGISNASKYYFNKDISNVSIEEAIILVGIPKSPNNYNPISNYESCLKRAKIVAKSLYKEKIIDDNEYNSLDFNKVNIYGKLNDTNLKTLMYYQDAVISELYKIESIPKSLIESGGLKIYTNLDIDTQSIMEEAINTYTEDDDNQISSILVEPDSGKIIALAGGKDYSKSQYNRVISSKRQVGSTIKPFLYYAALNSGMTTASTFKSEVTSFVFGENKTYSPTNYGNTYGNKNITMAAALAYSDNIYAVKTHLFLGESTLVNTLKTCGLRENIEENPSLALGATEINMIDYATIYSTLASLGQEKELYLIRRIEDSDGNILYEHKDESYQVLDPSINYILNETLTNTYNYNFKDYYSPTVLYLNGRMSKKYSLKSGTTDNDYWIAGYNSKALMIVWAGNDTNKDVSKSYSKHIKDIWLDTIEYYENNMEDTWYLKPDNVVAVPMDPISGKYNPKSNTLFYFLEGSELPYIK